MIDVYESAVDHAGRYGAAFERDDDTAFFYLLDLAQDEASQVIEAFNVHAVSDLPADVAVALRWTAGDNAVGLFIGGRLLALFDLQSDGRKGRWASGCDNSLFVRH